MVCNMNKICENKLCTGCSTCYSVCPVHCIKMVKDEFGFEHPIISDACIKCGLCVERCPINNIYNKRNIDSLSEQKAFAALSNSTILWKQSSSGGAFAEICKAWGNRQTLICAAKWEGFAVKHEFVVGIDNIEPLQKSKYMSSSIGNSFVKIKKYLEDQNSVLFCGTPCQVAGLRSFLNKDYDNLLLIDLICHGVGSPDVFISCIKVLEQQFKCSIASYSFRQKKGGYRKDHIEKIETSNGKKILIDNDPYIQLFTSQRCLRESCGKNCKFRTIKRQGDITIGDFKHLSDVFPDLIGSKRNFSTIVFNTLKGSKLIEPLGQSMLLRACNIDTIVKYNPVFGRQSWAAEDRNMFFSDYHKDKQKAISKWSTPARKYKLSLFGKIFDYIPIKLRKIVLQGGIYGKKYN